MLNYNLEDRTVTFSFPDRVTTDNAAQVRKDVFAVLESNEITKVVINLADTEYISSSGLRVLVSVAKKYKNLDIVSVSLDVYEVLDMTGMTSIMNVVKKYKEVSIEGCKIIGSGKNGDVYRLNGDTIVKVFKRDDCIDSIKKEHELAKKAFIMGVPTALSFDVVKVGEKYGALYELLDAKSIAELIVENPATTEENVMKFINLLKETQSIEVNKTDEMLDKKADFRRRVDRCKDIFSADLYATTVEVLDEIPESNHFIHGDFHMGNVMQLKDELLIIDLDKIGYGDGIFDMINLYSTLVGFEILRPEVNLLSLAEGESGRIWNIAVKKYYEDLSEREFEQKLRTIKILGLGRVLDHGIRNGDNKEAIERVMKELELAIAGHGHTADNK